MNPNDMNDPINTILWLKTELLQANDYNPNAVFSPELKLLERSILKTGWVQPILVSKDYTIIDGFHRYSLSKDSTRIKGKYHGFCPCAVLDVDRSEAMILTVRMNRAKGSHIALRMSAMVKELANNLPNAEKISVLSNAEGAKIASKEKHSAAIASSRAANLFKLNILQNHIEDEPNNTTRFLILSDQEIAPSGNDKTSIVVATKNKPGAIVDLIQPFASRKVSLTKLESRPSKIGMWEYVFFIDVEGHRDNSKVKLCLKDIEKKSSFMKFLGSYPKN